jgi:hypothetical protein
VQAGGTVLRLVPLATWRKGSLVAFVLRDERGAAIRLPTSEEVNPPLASALAHWAAVILSGKLEDSPVSRPLPPGVARDLAEIVCAAQADLGLSGSAAELIGSAVGDGSIRDKLTGPGRSAFASQLEELARDSLLVVAVPDPPGTGRVLELSFESDISFRRPERWWHRPLQSLGWQPWNLDVLVGGRGGAYHLEVASPAGVDIMQISARPAAGDLAGEVTAAGFSPHVHLAVPGLHCARQRATILTRASRSGFISACWGAAIAIAFVQWLGRLVMPSSLSPSSGPAPGDVQAILWLSWLALCTAAVLTRSHHHPLASRMLRAATAFYMISATVVVLTITILVVHNRGEPAPTAIASVLALVATCAAVLLTISRLLPRVPRPGPAAAKAQPREQTAWQPVTLPDADAVRIPSAGGYHYGDDHSWGPADQAALVRELRRVEEILQTESERRSMGSDAP